MKVSTLLLKSVHVWLRYSVIGDSGTGNEPDHRRRLKPPFPVRRSQPTRHLPCQILETSGNTELVAVPPSAASILIGFIGIQIAIDVAQAEMA
jgi:hypothetical protein